MNIEFTCANCGANLKVLKTFAGKSIQCPKCTKKTAVPAADGQPAPAAAKPAPAAGTAVGVDGVYVSFNCGNCSAPLKVVKSFSGKVIQCPKCAKKTQVPGLEAKDEAAAKPASAAVPEAKEEAAPAAKPEPAPAPVAAVPPVPVKKPAPAPASAAVPEPVPEKKPDPVPVPAPVVDDKRLREQEQKLDAVMRQMRDMELRLEIEKMKAEKAEKEKATLAEKKADDRLRLQDELSVHFKAEMDAARQTISRLEDKIRQATEQNLAAPRPGTRSAAQIEKEMLDNPDEALTEAETAIPDAVMAQIRDSRFGRYMRTSILLHVVVMVLTSLGLIRSYFVKPPPPAEGEGGTNTVVTASAPAASPEAASDAPAGTPGGTPATAVEKPAAPAEAPAAKPAAPAAPAEALPAPGEKPPTDTSVNLNL